MKFDDVTINDLPDLCAFFGVHRASELNEAVQARTVNTHSDGTLLDLYYDDGIELPANQPCAWQWRALGPEWNPLKVTDQVERLDITWETPGEPTHFSIGAEVLDAGGYIHTDRIPFGGVSVGWLYRWLESLPELIDQMWIDATTTPFDDGDAPF